MITKLALDKSLIIEAQEIGNFRTKKQAVIVALKEYVSHKKQLTQRSWKPVFIAPLDKSTPRQIICAKSVYNSAGVTKHHVAIRPDRF
jgi:hypothetical protein